jgi:hypothetical protein
VRGQQIGDRLLAIEAVFARLPLDAAAEAVGTPGGADVIGQNIDPAEWRDRGIDRRLGRGGLAQVAADDGGAVAARDGGDPAGRFIELRLVARGQSDMHALARQFGIDRCANSAAGSGEQCNLAAEIQIHCASFPLASRCARASVYLRLLWMMRAIRLASKPCRRKPGPAWPGGDGWSGWTALWWEPVSLVWRWHVPSR